MCILIADQSSEEPPEIIPAFSDGDPTRITISSGERAIMMAIADLVSMSVCTAQI
jgi:hypothetical protein